MIVNICKTSNKISHVNEACENTSIIPIVKNIVDKFVNKVSV
jgi:hypothetical protein